VARLRRTRIGERYRIAVSGDLCAADLRRLERACAPALEHRQVPLELRVDRVRSVDEPARAFLERLIERGAALSGPPLPRLPAASQIGLRFRRRR
jgi:hypothetical protein